jgi:hypothetical protein
MEKPNDIRNRTRDFPTMIPRAPGGNIPGVNLGREIHYPSLEFDTPRLFKEIKIL